MFFKLNKWKKVTTLLIVLSLFLGLNTFLLPWTANAAVGPISVMVDGEVCKTFTPEELKGLQKDEYYTYSTISTWPTKSWYIGEGPTLVDLLEDLEMPDGLRLEDIQQIKFTAEDGFTLTFTKKELLEDTRYYFPGLKENDEHSGYIPGSLEEAIEVPVVLALLSIDSDDPDDLEGKDKNAPHLLFGQRWITEQTNQAFVKTISEIDLLTAAPGKWDNPTVTPEPGTVPSGTKVRLSCQYNDADKVYYTTDGSDPTYKSQMYNWVASRWWNNRKNELDEINKPIEITENTVIKAKTIGLGREDSDIVTFEYKIETVAVIGVNILEDDMTLEEGETVRLNAVVEPENAANKGITWSTDDSAVAIVDEETGLVTAVSEGETTITVTTEDGNFTDSIMVTVIPAEVVPVVTYTIGFSVKDGETVVEDAIIEVKNSEGEVVVAEADGNYKLEAGDYTYKVTKEGFKKVTETFTVESEAMVIKVVLVREADEMPKYRVIPEEDPVYTIGETEDGIKTMTVKSNQTGLNYFTVTIESIKPHEGIETAVFTHIRDGVQLGLNALGADFDKISAAKTGFNVKPGDVIKVYIVDRLTNDSDSNPVVLQ